MDFDKIPTPETNALYERMPNTFDSAADAFWCREMGGNARSLERRLHLAVEGLNRAANELGVPQPGYPAPVANAAEILRTVLRQIKEAKNG
jgi:hypothetical protein